MNNNYMWIVALLVIAIILIILFGTGVFD